MRRAIEKYRDSLDRSAYVKHFFIILDRCNLLSVCDIVIHVKCLVQKEVPKSDWMMH